MSSRLNCLLSINESNCYSANILNKTRLSGANCLHPKVNRVLAYLSNTVARIVYLN